MEAAEFDTNDPVASFTATWRRVILEPVAFFEALPATGGLQPAFLFALICFGVGGIELLVFGHGLTGMIGLVLLGLVRLFVGSAILTLIAQNLFEGRGDYESTFRALGYSSAVAVGVGLPIVKYFAALYGVYLAVIAIAKVHSFDNLRSLATVVAAGVTGFVIAYALGLGSLLHHYG